MIVPSNFYNLSKFLGRKKHQFNSSIGWKYYLSWEDGLWDLLTAKKIPQGTNVLIPSYYCVDVMNNIEARGYKCVTYEVDRNFQISEEKFVSAIKKYDPKVIIVFHVQGIQNELMTKRSWFKSVPKDTLILEDSVHLLCKPENIKIYAPNHFIIDSQRKVVPLMGSFVYGTKEEMAYIGSHWSRAVLYSLYAIFLYYFYQTLLWFGYTFQSAKVVTFSERILSIHNDLIGDSKVAGYCPPFCRWLYLHLDFDRIYAMKEKQVRKYEKKILSLVNRYSAFFPILYQSRNRSQLRGFPIGLHNKYADDFLSYLRKNGLLIDFLLKDCPWSQKYKLVLLPIGSHIEDNHIDYICKLVENYTLQNH